MARAWFTGGPAAACVVVMALAGCQMALPGGEAARAEGGLALLSTSPRVVERDVEAPQVFDRTEAGLWDGRPSLGGVWVAHPQASDPERVLIRNPQTGASVVGALFRRERENPGPRFQISSEAAAALGILAGAPSQVRVTALRLERVEVTPAPSAAADPAARPDAASQTATATTTGTASGDAAPVQVAAAPAQPAAQPAPQPRVAAAAPQPVSAQTGTQPAMTLIPLPDAEIAAADPEPRWRLSDLFRRRPAQPEPVVELAAVAVPAALPQGSAPVTATTAMSAAAPLDRPFVQIGIFSVESNATNARAQMQQAGLPVDIRRGRAGEREFWRVIVGPAADTAARTQMLTRVRGMGFADAYAVAR